MIKTKKLFLMLAMLLMSIGASAQSQLKGDVNNDGKVDEADITTVIEIMKNGGGVTDSNDVNKDGKVDVADIVAIIGIIKNGGSSSGEVFDPNSYYIYIGLNRPTSDTDIAADLASNNTPLIEGMASMGWRKIGQDISQYSKSNPAFNGGANTVCLDKNFNNVTCYVAIPVDMGIFDIFSEDTSWQLDQANITIKGHQYYVYSHVLEGEFTEIIYTKGSSSSGEVFDPNSYYFYVGLTRPTSETDIAADLASNNSPLHEDMASMGWRRIGPDISIYNSGNPAYNGGGYKSTVCLDKNFNDVQCYVAVPVGMHMYDGLGNLTASWTLDQENITIKGHQYNVYVDTLEGEFGEIIY